MIFPAQGSVAPDRESGGRSVSSRDGGALRWSRESLSVGPGAVMEMEAEARAGRPAGRGRGGPGREGG